MGVKKLRLLREHLFILLGMLEEAHEILKNTGHGHKILINKHNKTLDKMTVQLNDIER